MTATTRVDLHCHSSLSDGQLEPEELAHRLGAAGVAFASLTDHDTVSGLARFREAASRRGIGCINGLELTVQCDGREAHLLAYGFDPSNGELLATLGSLQSLKRDFHSAGVHSITEVMRNQRPSAEADAAGEQSAAPDGYIDISQAIAMIHRAGGKAFLAHPLLLERDGQLLRELLTGLKQHGLDGIEAVYAAFTPHEQRLLCELAQQLDLLVCGGADQHLAHPTSGRDGFGVDMPTQMWRSFREVVAFGPTQPASAKAGRAAAPPRRLHLRHFVTHIILPTVLAIAMFVTAIFAIFLPTLERALLDRKREMIRELTNSAWSILAEAHRQELTGVLTRREAQDLAIKRIEFLRYGREGKDYFWLQDTHPRMVMHPYRKDLNGTDVTEFRDRRGTRIFVEFADLVQRKKEGYVEYVWQWKDDPRRIAPKESYIRGFEPWGWIIGTGIYIEDVNEEIARFEQGLVYSSIAICVIVALLLFYVMRESLRLERQRSDAQQHLHESSERYRSLVEAATEGTLLVMDGRCRYANPVLLEMLGYSAHELELMDLADLLGSQQQSPAAWDSITKLLNGEPAAGSIEASLVRRDKSALPCTITLRPLEATGRSGLILLARPSSGVQHEQQRRAMIDRLLHLPGNVAADLAREVALSPGLPEIVARCHGTVGLVSSLLDCGVHPRHVTLMVASVCDAATQRLIELAMNEIGPAPTGFAFVALGSQGRQEQTLCTDQDNAIIYADQANVDSAKAATYFHQLGSRVCEGLAQAGYVPCRGDIMASNVRWCQPLSMWKRYFGEWIAKAEPRELLDFSIFFDFRSVFGDDSLLAALRSHVQQAVAATPAFFPHFAQHALLFRPPLGLFGRIVTGGASSESPGMLDMKAAMMPIVSFARLYALQNSIGQTGTLDRIAALVDKGAIVDSTHQDMLAAYESLMRLRLRHQCHAMHAGAAADNLLDPNTLGHFERAILKEALAEIEAVQHRVSYDFLGGSAM